MPISRRDLLSYSAMLPLAAGLAKPSMATLGDEETRLSTISDGTLHLPLDFLFGELPEQQSKAILAQFNLPTDVLVPECNLTLLQTDDRNILFDVGSGHDFMSSAGKMLDSLDEMDLSVNDVTDVVITHGHPDHIWGLLDDFDDLMFPDARYHMGRAEWDYWWNPKTLETIGDDRASFAVGAKRRMEMIEDMVTLFDEGAQPVPGITAIATPGHTPGHMSFEVELGSEKILVLGDAIGNHHLSFLHPGWSSGADQEPDLAVKSRLMLFDMAESQALKVVGFHLPNGGIGQVEKTSQGYQFIPT